MTELRSGVLFSGGKDSTYSAYLASRRENLVCLITLLPKRRDSYMFHFPNIEWTELQAKAMGLPRVAAETEGAKESELADLMRAISLAKQLYSIECVYTGALASYYQKSRVDRICSELGLKSVSPLWQIDPAVHLRNLLESGFSIIMTGVAALGLDENWLGRKLDEAAVDELLKLQEKYRIHAALEGGEGETFVLDCPLFRFGIEITSSRRHWEGDSGYLEILEAGLTTK